MKNVDANNRRYCLWVLIFEACIREGVCGVWGGGGAGGGRGVAAQRSTTCKQSRANGLAAICRPFPLRQPCLRDSFCRRMSCSLRFPAGGVAPGTWERAPCHPQRLIAIHRGRLVYRVSGATSWYHSLISPKSLGVADKFWNTMTIRSIYTLQSSFCHRHKSKPLAIESKSVAGWLLLYVAVWLFRRSRLLRGTLNASRKAVL